MAASSSRGDDGTIVEGVPIRPYIKCDIIIDQDESKVVYKGLDRVNNRDIAWIKKNKTEENSDGLNAEAQALMSFNHVNVLKCYHSWVDTNSGTLDMITEYYSRNLRDFTKNHLILDNTALSTIKVWCRQILEGLCYLHERSPAIIHQNIKCENIVIGESGAVKLGDLNEATSIDWDAPVTPFAGADLAAVSRSEIYYFGMCVLQMVTKEDVVRRPVGSRVMPAELKRVKDQQLKKFIRRCLVPATVVTTAADLLNDLFLAPSNPNVSVPVSDQTDALLLPSAMEIDRERERYILGGLMGGSELMLVFLRIRDIRHIFVFTLNHDTVLRVMEDMKPELGLSDEEAASISESMDLLIAKHVPGYDINDNNMVVISDCVSSLRILTTEGTSGVQHQAVGAWFGTPPNRSQHNQDAEQDQQQQQHGMPDDDNAAASDEEALLIADAMGLANLETLAR